MKAFVGVFTEAFVEENYLHGSIHVCIFASAEAFKLEQIYSFCVSFHGNFYGSESISLKLSAK